MMNLQISGKTLTFYRRRGHGGPRYGLAGLACAILLGLCMGACGDDGGVGTDAAVPCVEDVDCPVGTQCETTPEGRFCLPRHDAGPGADAGTGTPELVVSATELDFGAPIFDVPVTQPLTISNAGDGELRITGLTLLEDDALDEFALDAPSERPLRLAPGGEITIGVTLRAADEQEDRGYLLVASNDEARAAVLVALVSEAKGTPVLGACVHDPPSPPQACADPTVLDFGLVDYGGTAELIARLRNLNPGNAILNVDSVQVPEPPAVPTDLFGYDLYTIEEDPANPGTWLERPADLPYLLAPGEATPDLYLRVVFTAAVDRFLPELSVRVAYDATALSAMHLPLVWQVSGCPEGWIDLDLGEPGCEYRCPVWPTTGEACNGEDDDCDGEVDEGFDLQSDPNNCGYCGHVCDLAHASAECDSAICVITSCQTDDTTGWANVDGSHANGCEYPCPVWPTTAEVCNEIDDDCDGQVDEDFNFLSDPENCGGCGINCIDQGLVCNQGACVLTCSPGTEDCGGTCVDTRTNPDHCGVCYNECSFDFAQASCVESTCVMGPCQDGHRNLDGVYSNGCEYACPVWPTEGEICNGVDDDCDGQIDEGFDLQNDPSNCGQCDHQCAFDNAQALCDQGRCQLGPCLSGYGDANGIPDDGCECTITNGGVEICNGLDENCNGVADETFDLQNDPYNCGQCNTVCAYDQALAYCVAGQCVMGPCIAGFRDLNGDDVDGCEYACPVWLPEAEICNSVDDDCDGEQDEDFDLQNDPLNCGQCDYVCPSYPNAESLCVGGVCQMGSCLEAYYRDLNHDPVDGCEYECPQWPIDEEVCDGTDNDCDGLVDESFDLERDPENCGSCGHSCAIVGTQMECMNGACRMVGCLASYYDLNGDPLDGCEYQCPTNPPEVEICDYIDNDCDSEIDEGYDLQNDPLNCGACGVQVGSGEICCSGTPTPSDESNCGYCGRACPGGVSCWNGSCIEPGILIVTELMINPTIPYDRGEYVEIFNTTGYDINLNGWVLKDDGSDVHTITDDVWVPAGAYVVLGNNASFADNGGVSLDYQYSGYSLGNTEDEVVITANGMEIDRVVYDSTTHDLDLREGYAKELSINHYDSSSNDTVSNWCDAVTPLPNAGYGTPGADNVCSL